ncbi:MAG: hypothetical protein ACJAU2_001473 [Maribacter sp.]|jgi:hypothetical protein
MPKYFHYLSEGIPVFDAKHTVKEKLKELLNFRAFVLFVLAYSTAYFCFRNNI